MSVGLKTQIQMKTNRNIILREHASYLFANIYFPCCVLFPTAVYYITTPKYLKYRDYIRTNL